VRLWKAAAEAQLIRSEQSVRKQCKSIQDFIEAHDDWLDAVMLWFDDEPRIGVSWFTSRVPAYFGIHAEEWLGLTKTQPIVPLLASESSSNGESNWSVDDAYIILSSLPGRNLGDIIGVLSEDEAYLFWQVALGEPPPISRRQMLRAIARFTNYTTQELYRAVAYTPFLEVLEKAVSGILPTDTTIDPSSPLTPPARYLYWSKVSLPFNPTYVEVIDSPRHFLHYTGTDAIVYSRAGDILQSWESSHLPSIFEIECSDDYDPKTILYTDVLVHESAETWKQVYTERKSLLAETYKGLNVRGVRQIGSASELREALRSLKPEQSMRLIDDIPYYNGDFIGGYIMRQQALRMPLLVSHVIGTVDVHIRLAALDGHTPVYMGEVVCPLDIANNFRTHPHFGPRMDDKWTSMDDVGCIIWVSAVGIKSYEDHYHLDNPILMGLDTTLGFSDAIQLSDILSIMPE
jgi:hypothetical protein